MERRSFVRLLGGLLGIASTLGIPREILDPVREKASTWGMGRELTYHFSSNYYRLIPWKKEAVR